MKRLFFIFLMLCSPFASGFVEVSEHGVVTQGFFGDATIVINGQREMVSTDVVIRDINGNQVKIISANVSIQYERIDSNESNAPISQIWIVE